MDSSPRGMSRRQGLHWGVLAGLGGLLGAVLAGCGQRLGSGGSGGTGGTGAGEARPTPMLATRTPTASAPAAAPTAAVPSAAVPASTPQGSEASARKLPRWHGFNLLEKFTYDGGNRPFEERDFAWIAELGFNFVRLPMDYRCWSEPSNWAVLREEGLKQIDQAVRFGDRYGVHVCLNFHRAPGYTVAQPPEPASLWTDEGAQRVCALHWAHFAKRYQGISSRQLSFNLFNEPPHLDPQVHRTVVARLVEAIRTQDPQRLVICDGLDWGRTPPTELIGANVAAATRGYDPMGLTHFRAEWISGADRWETPAYPLREGTMVWSKDTLHQRRVEPWRWLEEHGMGVIVGEFGAYNKTPHQVVLAWLRDSLQLWQEAGWGWAMWNFRGPFGLIDSGRTDVVYETWHGRRLDRALLDLLLAFRSERRSTGTASL